MKKMAFGGGAVFVLFFALALGMVSAAPDCGFGGTVSVYGGPVSGDQVKAYLAENDQLVGSGLNASAGYGMGIEGAPEEMVYFKVSGLFVDQPDQLCTDPENMVNLSLTVTDGDRDGYNYTVDCDDTDPEINPGMNETAYNGMDDDCNPATKDNDLDNDGYNYPQDCNDNDASINPGATDVCNDGIDQDCSGVDAGCGGGGSGGSGGSGGGGGGGSQCTTNWTCTEWSACSGSVQTRTCSDANTCGINSNRPAESQACTAAQACTAGMRVCEGDKDLMECNSQGQWVKIQECDYLCSGNACLEKPAEAAPSGEETGAEGAPVLGMFLLEPSAWPYWILIIIVIALAAWYIMRRGKKKKKK